MPSFIHESITFPLSRAYINLRVQPTTASNEWSPTVAPTSYMTRIVKHNFENRKTVKAYTPSSTCFNGDDNDILASCIKDLRFRLTSLTSGHMGEQLKPKPFCLLKSQVADSFFTFCNKLINLEASYQSRIDSF